MGYLHGVEFISVDVAGRPVQIVKTAVVGLVGIAPAGTTDITLVSSAKDAVQFGKQVPGFTIPQALDVLFANGAGAVLVINVFDPTAHTADVTAESKTVTNGALKLDFAPIGAVTVLDAEGEASDYVLNTDYSIDEFGNFNVLSSAIANDEVLKFTYKKLDISTVSSADIIGELDAETDTRTGMVQYDLAYNLFGFKPKILIAPVFSEETAVANQLIVLADKYKAITYIDAPLATTVAEAIAGRGPLGEINFNVNSKRAELLFPHLKKYDPATDTYVNFPYSAYLAGVRSKVDNEEGFWVSSSNKTIASTTGPEFAISAGVSDATSDANRLNEAGISTVFNTFGTGVRTWGNRNSSFPTNTDAKSFTNIQRISDIVDESLELAALAFIDRPINQALVDTIRESGNSFIRTLIQRGALIEGSRIKYNKADNTAEELAAGHIVFERIIMGPTPAERITYKSILDINLLANLR